MAEPITGRQLAILTFIATYIIEHGWSPSIREIGDAVHLDSTSSVAWQLNTLARRGYIKRDRKRVRSLSVIGGVDAILAAGRTPRATHRHPPGVGSDDWLRATRPPYVERDGRKEPRPSPFSVLDVWLQVQHDDPKIGADMTSSDGSAEDMANSLTEGAKLAGMEVGAEGFTLDPNEPNIIRTPPGGMYGMVFPDANRDLREGILLAVLSVEGVRVDPGRFRDGWIERRTPDGDPVIAIYTRNGGGNRECYCEPVPNLGAGDCTGCRGERFAQHPLCVDSPDDEFDSTYRMYYFTIPPEFVDRLSAVAQEHVDMSARWQTMLAAINAK